MSFSNYPPGAEFDPNAPWAEVEVPEKDFEITCSQSLSRTVTVTTNNYIPGASGVDYENDDEGNCYASSWQDDDDISDTDWSKEYAQCGYYTPLQLIQTLKEVLQNNLDNGIVYKTPYITRNLIKNCEEWEEDEIEYTL